VTVRDGELPEPAAIRARWQRTRTVARWAASIAVLGACGYYLATRTDRSALAHALGHANYWLVLTMTVGHLVVLLPLKA